MLFAARIAQFHKVKSSANVLEPEAPEISTSLKEISPTKQASNTSIFIRACLDKQISSPKKAASSNEDRKAVCEDDLATKLKSETL
jgi:hypothetical protein